MEQIDYADIMALGFSEEVSHNKVYFNQYGYDFVITTLYLTPKIYIDWAKETRLCKMVRLKKKTGGDIENEMPIQDLRQLKDIIHFFKEKKHSVNYYVDLSTIA